MQNKNKILGKHYLPNFFSDHEINLSINRIFLNFYIFLPSKLYIEHFNFKLTFFSFCKDIHSICVHVYIYVYACVYRQEYTPIFTYITTFGFCSNIF